MLPLLDLRGRLPAALSELPRPDLSEEGPVEAVRAILSDVRDRGDAALFEYTARFDGVELSELRVGESELQRALRACPSDLVEALSAARDAIEDFHRHRPLALPPYERDGVEVTHLELPVARAGLYAPGGLARYPSSVLMTAVPARVAGVKQVVLCVPPGPDGSLAPEILVAASLAGVDEIYKVGGAQAIGAMAYGTESIGRVDVIVGPGSKWVSIAQREVRGVVGVPAAFAGPSEVVVIADGDTPPDWAAIDVIVQAEHGPDGLAWLITWDEATAKSVAARVGELVAASPRREATESTLRRGGYAVLVDGPEEAFAVSNVIAPEHLEILTNDAKTLLPLVKSAGAIFLGPYAPASIGDYVAGPSHVLPTFATARFASVLGVEDFIRRVHAIGVDENAARRLCPVVEALSNAEGLPAHGEAVRLRIGKGTWAAR